MPLHVDPHVGALRIDLQAVLPRVDECESNHRRGDAAAARELGVTQSTISRRIAALELRIGKRLVDTLSPTWLRIAGYWHPRGGMPIDVFWQTGKAPEGLWVPDTGVAPYRGRG